MTALSEENKEQQRINRDEALQDILSDVAGLRQETINGAMLKLLGLINLAFLLGVGLGFLIGRLWI